MLLKQTKIVATISDKRCEVDFIRQLFEAGMNVVRLNTAHLDFEGLDKLVNNTRAVSNRIAILMDTKGPEVRTTVAAQPIDFHAGDRVQIVGDPARETTRECIAVSYPDFVRDVDAGVHVLIDDGDLELAVVGKTADALLCEVQNEATLGSRKSVNVPGVRINLPSLTERDRRNIDYAIDRDIDFIAHSFVRNRQDVLDIREILDAKGSDIRIIAKIENQEGVDNIDEILEVADGVMIARGDLGIEVPQERIPGIQRILIRKCILAKKPVIVATQMLHTMINNPRPTRAEVTDIANAIYYRTDALMLSGETAYGKYPVEAVRTMTKIAAQAEQDKTSASPWTRTATTSPPSWPSRQSRPPSSCASAPSSRTATAAAPRATWPPSAASIPSWPSATRRRPCATLPCPTAWRPSTCPSWPTGSSTTSPPCAAC